MHVDSLEELESRVEEIVEIVVTGLSKADLLINDLH